MSSRAGRAVSNRAGRAVSTKKGNESPRISTTVIIIVMLYAGTGKV